MMRYFAEEFSCPVRFFTSSIKIFLLLLSFSTQSEPSQDCIFQNNPFQTADFTKEVDDLKQYLLFDYPVSMPSNLKLDAFCLELWKVHLINRNLIRMLSVSGNSLNKLIQKLRRHTTFIEKCSFTDSCVTFEMTNISHFLEPIPLMLDALSIKMKNLIGDESVDFHNCTIIQCQPDPFVTLPSNTQGRTQPFQETTPGRYYWGLLIIPVLLICLLFIACFPHRKRFQTLPRFEETEL